MPIAAAVSRNSTDASSSARSSGTKSQVVGSTAGMMPAAPLVGAVTIRPPAAFSSLTAMAARLSQSMARAGRRGAPVRDERSVQRAARRWTLRPPGSVPSVRQPRSMHSRMTRQMRRAPLRGPRPRARRRSRWPAPARRCAARLVAQRSSRSAAVSNGCGTGAAACVSGLVLREHEAAADRVERLSARTAPSASVAVNGARWCGAGATTRWSRTIASGSRATGCVPRAAPCRRRGSPATPRGVLGVDGLRTVPLQAEDDGVGRAVSGPVAPSEP